jgi:hypothetical protein
MYNMSSDISKVAVVDSRIVQSRPAYAVEKGALSLTNAPFNAISSSSSQITFNVYVPSENVFVDRRVLMSATAQQQMTVTCASYADLESIVVPGRDFALCAMPLNSLCATIQATINDTTTVINSQDVLVPILRMTDMADNRLVRNCPTMLDTFQSYNDAYGTMANPLAGYEGAYDSHKVPNGAHPGLVFTDTTGAAFSSTSPASPLPAFAGAPYCQINGVPVAPPSWTLAYAPVTGTLVQYAGSVYRSNAAGAGDIPGTAASWVLVQVLNATAVTVYFKWYSTEPIVLSPFVFSDEHEWSTGLFGINNIQLLLTLVPSTDRLIRRTNRAGRQIAGVAFNATATAPFVQPVLNVQFLTPAYDVPLPPKSVVPYMEFPRFITNSNQTAVAPGDKIQIQSQTITLPQIPDLLIIYCKPSVYATDGCDGDWFLPLASASDGTANPLSVNFDNFSGLLSSHTTEELFSMSCKNGLKQDWTQWSGQGHSSGGSFPAGALGASARQQGQRVGLAGGILVLKPSQDITLHEGQAPSLVGNFTLQFSMWVKNTSLVAQIPQLFVITANSGFFETIRGSSRVIKGVLSEQDIINAHNAPMMMRSELDRMVGGVSLKSLSNVLSKARAIYEHSKPAAQAIKEAAHNMAAEFGRGGTGGGGSGGARTGGKKSLSSRLM